jgi:hypothetical protein
MPYNEPYSNYKELTMKVGKLLEVRIDAKHIEDNSKKIQRLITRRLKNDPSIGGMKIWKDDFEKAIAEIESEIAVIKLNMLEDSKIDEKVDSKET